LEEQERKWLSVIELTRCREGREIIDFAGGKKGEELTKS